MSTTPDWLIWARAIPALSQTGLAFTDNPFDRGRYEKLAAMAVEIFAAHTCESPAALEEWFAVQPGYATPKVDVRGCCFRDGQVLMVRERSDGRWCLPGGWADVGDAPAAAVEREIAEESGYQARAVKLLALYDRNKHGHPPRPDHVYKLFFLCELLGGAPAATMETDEVGFFGEHDLPELSTERIVPAQIARMFEHHRHPEWPADFD